jgi:small subunit ribosomal protein S5
MGQNQNFRRGPGGPRGPRGARPQEKSEFKEKTLDMRRVTRVVAGGKRFRFRATLVLGDEKGRIGIGVAKGLDVQQAVGKAKSDAKKNMITVHLKDGRTIAHEVVAKYSAAKVLLKPASSGHGLRAGGAVRFVLSLAGIKDATAKVLGRTPNKLTNAMATLEALKKLKA